ncbi:MAG: regulatory protein RecX, partial [Burkholderiales bacterium]|nr:regulatory protein RecX [Burkholderiales bacterium]
MPDTDREERKQAINHKAIALLAVQERSRLILRRKLRDRFKEPEDKQLIEECLDMLEEKKYL